MNKYPDFFHTLIGSGPVGNFFGFVTLAVLAAWAMIFIMATQKYKSVPDTPVKWSWKYFWADNLGRFIAGLVLIPLFIRGTYQYVNPAWMVFVSIGIGFGFLGLAEVAKNFGVWTTNALSKKIADKIKETESSTDINKS
jgi:phosphoglycerol transferase MdoB-like AlkP superfamily enzyme